MKTPRLVKWLSLECCCCDIPLAKWERYMEGATRANKRVIDALVHAHLPDLWQSLALNFRNPYNYHKTRRHLILVHSGIEYFMRYER